MVPPWFQEQGPTLLIPTIPIGEAHSPEFWLELCSRCADLRRSSHCKKHREVWVAAHYCLARGSCEIRVPSHETYDVECLFGSTWIGIEVTELMDKGRNLSKEDRIRLIPVSTENLGERILDSVATKAKRFRDKEKPQIAVEYLGYENLNKFGPVDGEVKTGLKLAAALTGLPFTR
jgi:hypothetical protein